jgi:peptide/nickel transport system permease protein
MTFDTATEALESEPSALVLATNEGVLEEAPARGKKRRFGLSITAWISIAVLAILILLALLAPVLDLEDPGAYAGVPNTAPSFSWPEPLGTDRYGHSMLSRIIHGGRTSLAVGFFAVALAMAAGTAIGLVAGYRKGAADRFISLYIDSALAFPPLILLFALSAALTPSISSVVIALAILFTPTFARLARAKALEYSQRDFVVIARMMGGRPWWILVRELLPAVLLMLSAYLFLVASAAIVAEAGLSFLGLGIPPPNPSWGSMISDGRPFLESHTYQVVVPALFILITVLAMNTLGEALRRKIDVRESALG